MGDFQNRTLICSVLFSDIVEYSRKPVAEQIQLKDEFNTLLSQALRGVAVNDRIILDTGDGAAISFIGDPEDALFVATGMRDVIASQPESTGPQLSTRMGINLGPVRLVKDINGQPNIIGDGINVAQRVMTFAKPGQVLVSRSYYEVVSRLSDESSKLFSYEGARTDKHIREHEVYAVGAIPAIRKRFEETQQADWDEAHETSGKVALARATRTLRGVVDDLVQKPRLATLLAVFVILAVALGARSYRETSTNLAHLPSLKATPSFEPPPIAEPASAPAREAPPPAPVAIPEPLPAIAPPKPEPEARKAVRTAPRPSVAAAPQPEIAAQPEARPEPPPRPAPVSDEPATVSFAISPWGEVHVDGKLHGVSPPLTQLQLTPGRHKIELKNTAAPSHSVTINAKPGEQLRIKHKFTAE